MLVAVLFCSCAANITSYRTRMDLDKALAARDISKALSIVEKPGMYKQKERLLYYLDAGMLHHYQGNWQQSNELLQQAEDAIQELYTKSVIRATGSMVLNDPTLEYSGEDYEDIYINVFKAINYLELGNRDAAMVEVRRVDDKLSLLEQKYARLAKEMGTESKAKVKLKSSRGRFHSSALARYISMLMYDANGQMDDARIDYDNVLYAFKSQPELYPFPAPALIHPQDTAKGNVLRVISFVNRGPYKSPLEMHIHTSKDLLILGTVGQTSDLDVIPWEGIDEGYYFKFSIPTLEERSAKVARVDVVLSDGRRQSLNKLEDMSLVARKSFELKEPMIILKSASRTVLKGLAAKEAKKKAQEKSSDLGATLLGLVADAAVFLSEDADLRISQFFPSEALITELVVPEGEQSLRLEYFSPQGKLVHSETRNLDIAPNQPNLICSWYF
ncbi:MAG: hypothetical protein M0R50_07030 [Candidatus Cloacimonetes bacterium]|nr:hypothetical protein [Candidatus Cloacimonadota bacterium]